MNSTKAIFPMDLEFTIDGINGFKFGDVLQFDGLPKRYTDSYVFTVISVTHEVNTNGEWTTTLKCNPRVRIK
jgi:phage protein D